MKQYETYKCNTCGCEVEVQETGVNAKLSCCGEKYKHEEMYPNFEAIAKSEGLKEIAR